MSKRRVAKPSHCLEKDIMNKKIKATQAITNPRMYPMPLPAKGSPDMITRIDLRSVMELAGGNLLANLDPKRNFLPYFHARAAKDGTVSVDPSDWPGHNLGRWWDAMLQLRDAIGFTIPVETAAAMEANVFRFFDNPDHLCLAPFDLQDVTPKFDLHSLREGLLALTAMTHYRQNKQAAQEAHAMVESLLRLTGEDGAWLLEKCDYAQRVGTETAKATWGISSGYPACHGRLIEALVWYYQDTGDPLALRAAERFARFHLANTTQPDGSLGKQPGGHTHSYFGTLRGLLLYGELTGQREYIDTVAATYRKTVRTRLKKSGFISHDMDKDKKGEPTSPGDAAQLALWLATRHDFTEFFDDVERIVRARLIPSQITDVPSSKHHELEPLLIGAFGGMHTEVHAGKIATVDITAAVIHSLVDVYRYIAVANETDLRIHFHFDYADKNVRITSQREKTATVKITPASKLNLWIRIPRWTPRTSARLVVAGKALPLFIVGDYFFVPRDLMPAEVTLTYDLPVSTEVEGTDNVDYSITWRGDEIIGISPNSDFLPFYPDAFEEGEILP